MKDLIRDLKLTSRSFRDVRIALEGIDIAIVRAALVGASPAFFRISLKNDLNCVLLQLIRQKRYLIKTFDCLSFHIVSGNFIYGL